MTKRISRILDTNNITIEALVAMSDTQAVSTLKWVTAKNIIIIKEEAEQALNSSLSITDKIANKIAIKNQSDEDLNPRRYTKMVKQVVASTVDVEYFENFKSHHLGEAISMAKATLAELLLLGTTDIKPATPDEKLFGTDHIAHRLLWAKYNNHTRIEKLQKYILTVRAAAENITLKGLKKVMNAIIKNNVKALRTRNPDEFIVNSILPIIAKEFDIPVSIAMNLIQALNDSNFLSLSKTTYSKVGGDDGAIDWMINFQSGDLSELETMRLLTSKQNAVVGRPEEITADTHMVSQRAWAYESITKPTDVVDVLNYFSDMRYSFRDGLTYEDRLNAYYSAILDDHNKQSLVDTGTVSLEKHQSMAIALYELEYARIMEAGNRFAIRRFLDSANRVYDESMFGFQQSSAMKELLRFADKFEYSDEDWNEVKWATVVVYEKLYADNRAKAIKHFDLNHKEMLVKYGDDRGYFAAIEAREDTNIILFLDATTQGTQLYGAVTCSPSLLKQGGATVSSDKEFVKAYTLLADSLNWKFAIELGSDSVVEIFNTDNVKSLHMTSLYNSGKKRLLEGRSFNDKMEEWEQALESEYETSTSKLGKLVPLLMTMRENDINLEADKVYTIFRAALKVIAEDALEAMSRVNKLVFDDADANTIYQWTSIDGQVNQYAMTKNTEEVIEWITAEGEEHSLTYHDKILEPKASWRGLAPRWIQSIDAYIVRYIGMKAMEAECPLALVHDSFGVPACYAEQLRQWYRDVLCIIVDADPLRALASEIKGFAVGEAFSLQFGRDRDAIKRQIQASSNALMY